MAAWVVFGTIHINSNSAWRIPSALQALPAIIQCSFAFVCPDSPRHLYYKGHHAEAKAMIIKYHSDGQDDDLAQWEYDEIAVALDAEQDLPKGIFAPLFNALKKTGYRKRLFIIMWLAICSQPLETVLSRTTSLPSSARPALLASSNRQLSMPQARFSRGSQRWRLLSSRPELAGAPSSFRHWRFSSSLSVASRPLRPCFPRTPTTRQRAILS